MIKRACSACLAAGTTAGVLLVGAPAFAQSGTVASGSPALHVSMGKAAVSRIYLPQDHHRYHHVFVHHHIIRHHTWDVADVNQGGMGYLGSSGSYGVPTYSVPTYSVPASGTSVGVPSYVPSGGYSVGPTNAPSISNSNVNNASIGPGSGIGNQFFG